MALYIVVLVLIFFLLWYCIGILPLPSNFPSATKSILYILLILFAIYTLLGLAGHRPF